VRTTSFRSPSPGKKRLELLFWHMKTTRRPNALSAAANVDSSGIKAKLGKTKRTERYTFQIDPETESSQAGHEASPPMMDQNTARICEIRIHGYVWLQPTTWVSARLPYFPQLVSTSQEIKSRWPALSLALPMWSCVDILSSWVSKVLLRESQRDQAGILL
jgi:hypothetical protein